MITLPPGRFTPLFKTADNAGPVLVDAFMLDVHPVTNSDFLAFVSRHPAWRRSRVPRIFAETSYLSHWTSDLTVPASQTHSPVTEVSWFAAKAYCRAQNKRLPRVAEREYVMSKVPAARLLAWYAQPPPHVLPDVNRGRADAYGIKDLAGPVWEWTLDFNAMAAGQATENDTRFACGGAAVGAVKTGDYATFMRYAFRGSLKANYTLKSLGFRCAKEKS